MRNALFEWTITAAALVTLATATTTPFRTPGWLSSSRPVVVDLRGGSTAPKKKNKKDDPVEEEEPVTVDAELLYLPGLLDTVITRTRKVRTSEIDHPLRIVFIKAPFSQYETARNLLHMISY